MKNKITEEYHKLRFEIMKAIISNPNYEFRQEDKKKYYDGLANAYMPQMKYELTVLEATRYADALMAVES